jgi:ABC-type multidrug transport system ATPase subunit/pSer/pThr/pTyr-binding forkhead associated (FHA) protein
LSGGITQALQEAPLGPELVVVEAGRAVRLPLGNRALVIGRDPASDLVVASRLVSARHARIEPSGDGHRIVDLGSTNGLMRAGQRLAPGAATELRDGDTLRIGDPATGGFVTLLYRNPGSPREAPGAAVVRRYALEGRPLVVIGRAGADIDLDNPAVSRRHAALESTGAGHLIRDLGAMNGTFVDGQRVYGRVPLARGSVVRIGPFKLVYDGASLSQFDERGALRIDAQGLSQEVAGGRFILRDVSLSIAPREFVALVGPSGAGKSTLMKALAGYTLASHGRVLVNGDDFYAHIDAYRAVLGYVPQEDPLHRELRVGTALRYVARLRLPGDTGGAEISQRVARVLEDVEMTSKRESRIDELSGGQRKRVSIAAELLADPSLFFLDEPTSGLDPGLEKRMMYTLRRLADAGRTVVLVTHATANITQCDHVAFMAEGRLVYFGPPTDALAFFRVDSGDFADIYTKLDGRADPSDPEHLAIAQVDLAPELEAYRRSQPDVAPSLPELWELRYRRSAAYAALVERRLSEVPDPRPPGRRFRLRRPGISSTRQLFLLARRYVNLLAQDRKNLLLLLLQAPVIGYLITLVAPSGALVGKHANEPDAKTVLFMLSTVAVWFGIINAAREIAKESAVYRRERLAGLSIGPYVLSKVLVLTLLVVVQSAALLAVVGTEVNLPANGVWLKGPLELAITTALTSLSGLAVGLCISAWAKTPDRAISFVPLALIPQILFSGVLFPFEGEVSTTRVLSWATVSRWAMDAYGATVKLHRLPSPTRASEPEFAATAENLVVKWQILGGYTIVCLVLACVLLAMRDEERS